jgi:hypothetical protein
LIRFLSGGIRLRLFRLPVDASLSRLSWASDGSAVSFVRSVHDAGNIWQQPFAGGPPTQITHFPED